MDIDTPIRVYNEALGVKGAKGKLIRVSEDGYYEVSLEVKERNYQAMLPISGTVILAAEPIPESAQIAIERY